MLFVIVFVKTFFLHIGPNFAALYFLIEKTIRMISNGALNQRDKKIWKPGMQNKVLLMTLETYFSIYVTMVNVNINLLIIVWYKVLQLHNNPFF